MRKLVLVAIALVGMSAMALPRGPVQVGGEESLDACGGWGIATVTTTLFYESPEGYVEFGVVNASQGVSFCDSQTDEDGEYYGVVYSEKKGVDCGVSSPIAKRQPYSGKCKSGWVKKEFLLLIAG